MRPEDILNLVRAQPFRPFRLHLNGGKAYDIRHPEMIRVSRSTALVFFPEDPNLPEGSFDRYEIVSMLLIERIETLQVSAHT